jgi:predicted dehydrogenase
MLKPSRRSVLKGLAAGGLNLLLPGGLYAQNGPRRPSPNGKLRIAFVGVGGRGTAAVDGLASEEFAAFCDVDANHAAGVFNKHPDVPRFKDFNEMLAKLGDTIDAVTVSTPDHTHFAIAMAAVKAGKHVYVEKPLCQTIDQTRQLLAATTKAGVKTQMGNQGHSSDTIRALKELVAAGLIGDVKSVDAWTDRPAGWWPQGMAAAPQPAEVPGHLAWDLWRNGRDLPYSPEYLPFKWRGWTAWGCGALGDMACHILDPFFFAFDPGMPEWIQAEAEGGSNVAFPLKSTVTYHFPARPGRPAFDLVWRDGKGNLPNRPDALEHGREMGNKSGGTLIYAAKETVMTNSHAGMASIIPEARAIAVPAPEKSLPRIAGSHFSNWTDAIRGTVPEASSHFQYAAMLNELVLLGVIAQRIPGERLVYDASTATFKNNDRANHLVREVV